MDDHISKLEHMGKETVKKLSDIRGSAQVRHVCLMRSMGHPACFGAHASGLSPQVVVPSMS